MYSVEPPIPAQYVSSSALPNRIPSAVCVGASAEPHFCLSQSRWRSMSAKGVTRQLISDSIGVVYDFAVERSPQIRD